MIAFTLIIRRGGGIVPGTSPFAANDIDSEKSRIYVYPLPLTLTYSLANIFVEYLCSTHTRNLYHSFYRFSLCFVTAWV